MNDPLDMREDPRKTEMKGGTSVSENNFISIPILEYRELIEARKTLLIVGNIIERDTGTYGTSSETKRALDLVLGIYRKEKAD